MMYLGIDQHARQITISLRDDGGDVLQARQVSTRPEKVRAFFAKLTDECVREQEAFIAVVEVCGFNDWLIKLLHEMGCHKVIRIQPEERKQRKTDRRDASALSELLWVNRDRFLAGKPVRGLRQVEIASPTDQENRRLTTLRKEASQTRTRLVNKIKHILRRHNLQWEWPARHRPRFRTTRTVPPGRSVPVLGYPARRSRCDHSRHSGNATPIHPSTTDAGKMCQDLPPRNPATTPSIARQRQNAATRP